MNYKTTKVYFGQCLQAALIYRSALAIFVITESFAFAGFIAFWYQAAKTNPSQTVYTGLSLTVYFILAAFHHAIQDHGGTREVGNDIRMGKLSYSLIRPYPYLLMASIRSLALTLTRFLLLLPLLFVLVAVVPPLRSEFIHLLQNSHLDFYILSLVLGVASAILARMAIGMLAFDMSQIWGPDTMLIAVYFATSGTAFPIDIAPQWILSFAKWTPTYYMCGFPTLVAMGRISPETFWLELGQGVLVLTCVVLVMGALWSRGIKKFEAIGI